MGNVIVVEKCQRPAALMVDAVDREHPALLADRLLGDEAAGRQAEGMTERTWQSFAWNVSWADDFSGGEQDDGWAGITG